MKSETAEIKDQLRVILEKLEAINRKIDKASPVWEGAAWGTAGEVDRIKRAVETAFGLPEKSVDRETRQQLICWPRQIAMFLVREITCAPFKTIGEHFGKKHHGTVINACQLVSLRAGENCKVKTKLDLIRRSLAESAAIESNGNGHAS